LRRSGRLKPSVPLPDLNERRALRRELRAARRSLAPGVRAKADERIRSHLSSSGWLKRGRRIGLYTSMADEVDTQALRALCQRRGCAVYLPRITHFAARHMRFCRDRGTALLINRLGIEEPALRECLPARWLSLILLPILGFDERGTRLGYGGGFYDRDLAFRRATPAPPLLIGVAYASQEVALLPRASHDVPLDGIVTERGIRYFQGTRKT
jgi:5-formyltetrahydrofolate cyclo-ligase